MRDDLIEAGHDLSAARILGRDQPREPRRPPCRTEPHPTMRDRANRPTRVPGSTPAGQGIPIPESVAEIVILGDGDSDPFLTSHALARASLRWAAPGRVIRGAMARRPEPTSTICAEVWHAESLRLPPPRR